jgi:homoserine O-acetyltransferase
MSFAQPQIDAFCTSGNSPTDDDCRPAPPPTLHLLGVGKVGQAFLELFDLHGGFRLTGVTDSSATVSSPCGLEARRVLEHKRGGRSLREWPGAATLLGELAVERVAADVVIDATPSSFDLAAVARSAAVLRRRARLVLAAKDTLCRSAGEWLRGSRAALVGINAALGGTGRRLQLELDELRRRCSSVAVAGNASTTAIIEALECGLGFEQGLQEARRRGLLEPDPEQDLQGVDAAIKLAIVAGALVGRAVDPQRIERQDLRSVDPEQVRERARRGATTRLVGRRRPDGGLQLTYEEVEPGSPLAVPCDRVVYLYELDRGERRVHLGAGVGPLPTAAALWADVPSAEHPRSCGGEPSAAPPTGSVSSISLPRSAGGLVHLPGPFRLEHGSALPACHVAYELQGPAGAPVVVVQGGISAGRHASASAEDPRPGWWPGIVGEGSAVDPCRYRILSFDYLGGQGASVSPHNTTILGSHFPSLSSLDQARALLGLLDRLGVDRLHAFVGASYGGMVGLALAALAPDRVRRLLAVSAADRTHPLATAWRTLQRRIVRLGLARGAAREALALARGLAMTTYRSAEEFSERFDGPPERGPDGELRFPVEDYLESRGREFTERFAAETYLCLSESIDLHRVDPLRVQVPTTLVAVTTDSLVPLWQLRALAQRLGGLCTLVEVDSRYGHDAFLKEPRIIGDIVRSVLEGKEQVR